MGERDRYGSCPNHNTEASQGVRRIDYEVQRLGGRTSVSHGSITCVRRHDDQVSLRRRIVELNRENGTLEHEDAYFTVLANDLLTALKTSVQSHLLNVADSLQYDDTIAPHHSDMGSSVAQAFVHHRPHTDGFLGFGSRKDSSRGLPDPQRPRAILTPSCSQMERHRPLPPTPHPMSRSMLEKLEIDLMRQNGMMRQSISLNRKLHYRVLLGLVSQIRQVASALRSVVEAANLVIEQANNDWRQHVADVMKEEQREAAEPERKYTGPELAGWFESEGWVCSTVDGLALRFRDSDISLASETAETVPGDEPGDFVRILATQATSRDSCSLNGALVSPVDPNSGKDKDVHSQTWPHVEPLRITHERHEPEPDSDTVYPGSNPRRRLTMLHYERQYYERLVNKARSQFLPTIRHHIRELQSVLHDYGVEEDRLRGLLQEQIRLRTPEDPAGCG